jgi:hypothetical protein
MPIQLPVTSNLSYAIRETGARPRRVLRAVIELADGELRIFAVADNDSEEREIIDALRSATTCGDFAGLLA